MTRSCFPLRLLLGCALSTFTVAVHAAQPANFLFMDSEALAGNTDLIERPDVEGVQIVYNWKSLEPAQDQYDFARDYLGVGIIFWSLSSPWLNEPR